MKPITAEEAFMLGLMVSKDKRPNEADAVVIHGSPTRTDSLDKGLMDIAESLVRDGTTDVILINGLSGEQCKKENIAYAGYEFMEEYFDSELGIRGYVQRFAGAKFTPPECYAVIDMAEKNGWKTIIVMTQPHHLARVMLQWVYCLQQRNSKLKVYARTLDEVDWQMDVFKPILGGGTEAGKLTSHIGGEWARIAKYSDKEGTGYTPNATPEELFAYLAQRDVEPVEDNIPEPNDESDTAPAATEAAGHKS